MMRILALLFLMLVSAIAFAGEILTVETELVVLRCNSPRTDCTTFVYLGDQKKTIELRLDVEDGGNGAEAVFNYKFVDRNIRASVYIYHSMDREEYWLAPGAFIDYDSAYYPTVTVYYGDLHVRRPTEINDWALPRAYTDDGLFEVTLYIRRIH